MTKDEALRMAVKALNSHIVWFSRDTMIGKSMRDKSEKAIKACEEALAQLEREPVECMCGLCKLGPKKDKNT